MFYSDPITKRTAQFGRESERRVRKKDDEMNMTED